VPDYGNNRIQKFTSEGQFLMKWGSEGNRDGQLKQPAVIAFDSSNLLYVTDSGSHRVQVF
jgi:tripartite motif-containing protein 71